MKQIVKNQKFSIFDDVFAEDHLNHLNLHLLHAPYNYPYSSDGVYGVSKPFRYDIIYNNAVDGVFTYAKQIAEVDGYSWTDCTLNYFSYPRGTKNSWKSYKNYKAVMYFYVHSTWKYNWGGETLIGQTPADPNFEKKALLDSRWHDEHLSHFGTGVYAFPKSNRCVLIPGSEWHQISQINDDAGENTLLLYRVLFS